MSENSDNDGMNRERPPLKIEDSLPIRTVGIETKRERLNFTDLPPQNYVHVWWARRPTPVSRLAILASALPENVSDESLLKWLEIDPDNLTTGESIPSHIRKKRRTKEDREGSVYEHYGYKKIWKRTPSEGKLKEIQSQVKETWGEELPTVLDATAGGGSIPFESVRYEFPTVANELNPVASIILKAVLEHPRVNGNLSEDIRMWGGQINEKVEEELEKYFPKSADGREPLNYLWANTVTCPDCRLEVPLAPNWWIDKKSGSKGLAVRPKPMDNDDQVDFELVRLPAEVKKSEFDPTEGTVSRGEGSCPRCAVAIEGDEIKDQAQSGEMDYQLYCVEYRDLRDGSRGNFRSPNQEDIDSFKEVNTRVNSDLELSNFLNVERYVGPADRSANYGITTWRDMFSPRQLLVHYTYWQAFEEVKDEIKNEYSESTSKAILTFLAISADKAVDYNNRLSAWDPTVPKLAHSFERHDFAFKWSFVEMNMIADGGYSWVLENTIGAYEDLHQLSGSSDAPVTVLQQDAGDLSLGDKEVDIIVLDPPYYDNVMYAELSDFFYVWLQKYLGDLYPEIFQGELTEKHAEAVANEAKFEDVASNDASKGELAKQDYEEKMTDIFSEMYRVLDDDGVFTLMFTHKKVEAWDTLTKALINAGFSVKATHPVSTENPRSLHQRGKNAAESTILLSSEKRQRADETPTLWEDVESETRQAARERARELDQKEAEFAKVDMILASFGPTLRVFTENYPVVDASGEDIQPQEALDEARNAVSDYLIDKYLNEGVRKVDPKTEWYILSWLIFEAQRFPYDEARRLAIGVGEDLDDLKRTHRMWRKRSGDVLIRPLEDRVQDVNKKPGNRSGRKPVDPEAVTFPTALDKVQAALHVYDGQGATEAWNWMNARNCDSDPEFKATLEALLRVLPHDNEQWEIAQNLAAGDTGEMLDLDLDARIFHEEGIVGGREQSSVADFGG